MKFTKFLDVGMSDNEVANLITNELLIPVSSVNQTIYNLMDDNRYDAVICILMYSHNLCGLTDTIPIRSEYPYLEIFVCCVTEVYNGTLLGHALSKVSHTEIFVSNVMEINERMVLLINGDTPEYKGSYIFNNYKATDINNKLGNWLIDFPENYMEEFSIQNYLPILVYGGTAFLKTIKSADNIPVEFWKTDVGRLLSYEKGDDIDDFMYGDLKLYCVTRVTDGVFGIELQLFLHEEHSSYWLIDLDIPDTAQEIIHQRKLIMGSSLDVDQTDTFVINCNMSNDLKKWIAFCLMFLEIRYRIIGLKHIPTEYFTEVIQEHNYPILGNYIPSIL